MTTLADTSVWIEHLGRGHPGLVSLLAARRVVMHEFVLGELAAGNLARRAATLADLAALRRLPTAPHDRVMSLVETHRLHGRGLTWIDLHLLAASAAGGARLWTLDRRLADASAAVLGG